MFVDESRNMFITSFRGSNSFIQLAVQGFHGYDTTYRLYTIPQAMVTEYFYKKYVRHLRNDFLQYLQIAISKYPSMTFAFTGHSLGGALTTHASLDAVLGNLLPSERVIMYNFGSPRVGNYAFASKYSTTITNAYRVVHWEDLVPHVPPCSSPFFFPWYL